MDEYTRFIEELKQRASIVDVVSGYTDIVRRGSRLMACCPLHVEKTPSFCIYDKDNSYYCFGCHAGGDVIKLVEEMEKTDFKGAVEFLAKKYNMEVPTFHKGEDFAAAKKKKDRLYQLTRETALHYHLNLMSPKGEKARAYLAGRGMTQDTITQFGLGYSIDGMDLVNHLHSKGFTDEEMAEARVAYRRTNGSYIDPQAGRFVTPIINSLKNVVAFGGRIIEKNDDVAKYYNSMESPIFHKSFELFGQPVLKSLRNVHDAILVEGYMDVISLYQAGIKNAVASMGTALTEEQAKLVKRYADKVYFMYDGDGAGQKGMQRGVDILKRAGLDVYVVVLEDDMDPDEYIKKFGAEAMKTKIYTTAMPIYDYKLFNLTKIYDIKTKNGRGDFAVAAIDAIKDIQIQAMAEPYIMKIERMTGISSSFLFEQFTKAKAGATVSFEMPKAKDSKANDAFSKAVKYIIFALFGGIDGVHPDDEFYDCCRTQEEKDLYNIFRARQGYLTIDDLSELSEENSEVASILLEGNSMINDNSAAIKYFQDCRKLVLKEVLEQKRKELTRALDTETDEAVKITLVEQLAQTMNYLRKIK